MPKENDHPTLTNDVIIKEGTAADFKALRRYVDDDYQPIDITLFGVHFFTKFELLNYFYRQPKHILVAYSESQQRAVGIMHLQRISDVLWGVWATYVGPDFRRRGIASDLYRASFDYLKSIGVKKAISSVSASNLASVANFWKVWGNFLDRAVYTLSFSGSGGFIGNVSVGRLAEGDVDSCFDIFSRQVSPIWMIYLDLSKDDFLNRVFGSAGCETYTNSIVRRLILQKRILTFRGSDGLMGYCVYGNPFWVLKKINRLLNSASNMSIMGIPHVFARSISGLKFIATSVSKKTGFVLFYWIDTLDAEQALVDAGFKVENKELVPYRTL